jgi:hypothetical protein
MAGAVATREPETKGALGAGLVLLVIAACGPALVWRRPDTTDAQRRRDEAECAARADMERSVPVIVQRVGPGSQGLSESIELQTRQRFDVDVYRVCMEGRGYQRVPATPGGG